MPALKIGIQVASLRQPLRQGLRTAQRLGAAAVELDARNAVRPEEMTETALRHFRKLLADLNLRVCALAYPTRRGYSEPDDLDRRIAGTKQAMKLARALGAGVVINDLGHIPDEDSGPARQLLLEVLTDLGRFGQHYGALLAAETGATGAEPIERLLKALPAGSLAVNLNPGNLVIHGHAPLDAVSRLGSMIMHVAASDGVQDLSRRRGLEVQLGRGSVDFPALLGALEEQDYRGYFTIQRSESRDPIAEISDAVQYLRAI